MDNSMILSTGSTAVLGALILQALKNSKAITFLGDGAQHAKANAVAAAVLAGLSSLGIHFAFDATAGVLTVTGLHAASVMHGLWQWVTQYVVQHLAYKSAIVPVELAVKNGRLLTDVLQALRDQQEHATVGYDRVVSALDKLPKK